MHSALASKRLKIMNYMRDTFQSDISRDVLQGLTCCQKTIPSKYFYDGYGSRLFEEICGLPEYYQTRAEVSILKSSATHMVRDLREADIIELGSGSNLKIRTLLDACIRSCKADICYMPVDMSESALVGSSVELLDSYPDLKIVGIVSDFTKHIGKITAGRQGRQKLFVFFGSTIGNFSGEARIGLLKSVAEMMGPGDRFLLGIDMIKPVEVIERAYNDSMGVTAKFNKNILNVLNRELNADFAPSNFDHVAFYRASEKQVEMHLRANRSVLAEINGLGIQVSMEKGETIHTEICRKFSRESAWAMAEEAGLRIDGWYSDPQGWFFIVELVRMDQGSR